MNFNARPVLEVKNKNLSIQDDESQIVEILKRQMTERGPIVMTIECHPTTDEVEFRKRIIDKLGIDNIIHADEYYLSDNEVHKRIDHEITDDRVYGYMTSYHLNDFIDANQTTKLGRMIEETKNSNQSVVIYGVGASLLTEGDVKVYVDLTRWEAQLRYKSGQYSNWKTSNLGEDPLKMIKQAYYFEWVIADEIKKEHLNHGDFIIEYEKSSQPKMMTMADYRSAMKAFLTQPFSLIPYFDEGIWGGHFMQDNFKVGQDKPNLAWCFHGVPEENSLEFSISGKTFETPGNNLVYLFGEALLGERVFGRFGEQFPIRFNLLDTMGGGNLSLQVHPKTTYIQSEFGMHYTQDESYYLLEAGEGSKVFLGLKDGVTVETFKEALEIAQTGGAPLDDKAYINGFDAHQHDHMLIPAGTVHSAGENTLTLEISATPNRFTFKLWDWGRTDKDGLPRPVHLNHGIPNIDPKRQTKWVEEQLVNHTTVIAEEPQILEEKTGLHELEFIETRRHTFSKSVIHDNFGSFNMLSLVTDDEAVIESLDGSFEPFRIGYAEAIIIPETIKQYRVTPIGESIGKEIKTIKAFVR